MIWGAAGVVQQGSTRQVGGCKGGASHAGQARSLSYVRPWMSRKWEPER